MNSKDIIYQRKLKNGQMLLVRPMRKTDLKDLLKYANKLSREKTFVLFQGEKITLKQEQRFVDSHLRTIKERTGISLLVFIDRKLVGITEMASKKNSVLRHVGELGISIHRDARGNGIGLLLMRLLVQEAKKRLPRIKILTLSVFGENTIAQKLYRKVGFREFGKLPKGIRHRGKFDDLIYMYKRIRN